MAYGLSVVVALTLCGGLILGLVDFAIRIQDHGVRAILSGLFLGLAGWAVYRYLMPVIFGRFSDVTIARRIERRYPRLEDRLSSAVEFLAQSEHDPTSGSAALRRAVVAQAAAQTEDLNLSDVLDGRRSRQAMAVAVLVAAVVGTVVCFDPASSGLAAWRLMAPFGRQTWPRLNDLAFVDAPRLAATGSSVDFQVEDRNGRLPEQVTLWLRFEGDDAGEAGPRAMKFLDGKMVYTLVDVARPLEYRAVGGDHSNMPWIALDVTEPARLESIQVALTPPAYTGWPAERALGDFAALQGTQVAIRARATRPLASARLAVKTQEGILKFPVRLDQAGTTLAVPAESNRPWVTNASGSYWFEWADRQGLRGRTEPAWEVRVVADAPPVIAIDGPQANAYLTAGAKVAVRATVRDDLAVCNVRLQWALSASDRPREPIALYEGPTRITLANKSVAIGGDAGEDVRRVRYDWLLTTLGRLAPGTVVSYYVEAEDYNGGRSESAPQRLVIIDDDQLLGRITRKQDAILGQLVAVLHAQRQARSRVGALRTDLAEHGRLDKNEIDRLRSIELTQRRIDRQVSGPHDGVRARITALLAQLRANRVDSPEVSRRMIEITGVLDRLWAENVPIIRQQLVAALKLAQAALVEAESGMDGTATVDAPLSEAGRNQDAVIASLEQLVGDLAQWDDYRKFAGQISSLRRDQRDVAGRVGRLRKDTLTHDVDSLTAVQRDELSGLADKQLALARRLEAIEGRMRQTLAEMRVTEPSAAATLGDALDVAARLAIAAKIRQLGSDVRQNRLGQAGRAQADVVEALQEVLDVLTHRRERALLDEPLARLEQAVEGLIVRQQGLVDETVRLDTVRQSQGRWTRAQLLSLRNLAIEQQSLADECARLAEEVARAKAFQLLLGGVTREMRTAADRLGERRTDVVTGQYQQTALDRLGLLLEALRSDDDSNGGDPDGGDPDGGDPDGGDSDGDAGGGGSGGGADGGQGGQQPHGLAELKLVLLLQQEINRRTVELDSTSPALRGPGHAGRLRELAAEQGQLAELVPQLAPPATTPRQPVASESDDSLDAQLLGELEKDLAGDTGIPQRRDTPEEVIAEQLDTRPDTRPDTGGEDVGPSGEEDPLTRLGRRMKAVEQAIAGRDTSVQTQQKQEQIVRELSALIAQIKKNQCKGSSKPSGGSQQPPPGQDPKPPGQKPTGRPTGQSIRRTDSADADDSQADNVEDVLRRVWGHLPAKIREQIQQTAAEQALPKYEKLVEDYFKRLAEDERNGP